MFPSDLSVMRYNIVLLSMALSLSLAGCGKSDRADRQDKPLIAVSIEPLRNIVERIAGDNFDVITILDKGANPETFDPSMSKRAAADRSAVFFTVGAFPFEEAIEKSGSDKSKAVDVSDGIKRLYGTHGQRAGHECGHAGDPHTWTSVRNMRVMAGNITDYLSEIDPDHAEEYKARSVSLSAELDSIDQKISERLSGAKPRAFAIWHPSLGYFANDYGLKQIAVGEESKEISPRRLKEIIAGAAGDSVRVFFFQKEYDSRQAEAINEQLGSRIVNIDLLGYDWLSQIEAITDELTE